MSFCSSLGQYLIFIAFITSFNISGINSNFFVILFEGSQILTGFGEFTFFHTFSDVPVDECPLGVHKIKLMIKTSPGFSNSSGVRQHTNSTLNLGKITTWYYSWWLVVNSDLETSWTPVDKLNRSLSLNSSNGSVDILGNNIASVQKTASHVFSVSCPC